MKRSSDFIGGLALGMAFMYFADPDRGATRRARLRDRVVWLRNRSRRYLGKAARDLQHRTTGLVAESASRLRHDAVDDETLRERIRSKLGRYVSHPHAIEVETWDQGHVTLRGPIFTSEAHRLLRTIGRMPGVTEVDDQLELHEGPDVSALQGGRPRDGEHVEWRQGNWSPAMRLIAGVAVGSMLMSRKGRRVATGIPVGVVGLVLLARALSRTVPNGDENDEMEDVLLAPAAEAPRTG